MDKRPPADHSFEMQRKGCTIEDPADGKQLAGATTWNLAVGCLDNQQGTSRDRYYRTHILMNRVVLVSVVLFHIPERWLRFGGKTYLTSSLILRLCHGPTIPIQPLSILCRLCLVSRRRFYTPGSRRREGT